MSYVRIVLVVVIFAEFLSGGCAAYTKAIYGEGPASEDYTKCMSGGLEALGVGTRLYIDSCMKKAGWERLPGQQPEGPSAFRRIGNP
jgi:hypothetical protein